MRKLVTIREISSFSPIEGADRIELAHVDGWQCVVGKGQFKEHESVLFYEIDSALPSDDVRYDFLKQRCNRQFKDRSGVVLKEVIRIKTSKFKGQISQGLCMPLSMFPEVNINTPVDELTDILHVQHFDDVLDEVNRLLGRGNMEQKGRLPSFIVKTDEERIQNLTCLFTTDGIQDMEFECTEKFDGSSETIFWAPSLREDNPFGVCSRNFELKVDEANNYVDMAKSLNIEQKLKDVNYPDVAIQGELVGVNMNGNRDKYESREFRVFRIMDIKNNKWYTPEERYEFCNRFGLQHVKIIRNHWNTFKDFKNVNDFLEFVKGKTDHGNEREGMVWKSMDGTVSFKVINNDYLLKIK